MADYIDLDLVSGQLIQVGNTTQGKDSGQVKITNTDDGQIIASLDQFLDFGGAQTKSATVSTLTIDIYGRVVGFSTPDDFYYTFEYFTATSGQTVFTPATRNAAYITGQDLIFINGVLLSISDYTETSTTFTLNTGATVGDKVACMSMRATSGSKVYSDSNIVVSNIATNTVTWNSASMPYQSIDAGDSMTFANTGLPTAYTVSSVDYVNRQIVFTVSVSASIGDKVYFVRNAASSYRPFTRYEFDITALGSYSPNEWQFNNGYEFIFINGTSMPDPDYDISGNTILNFPSTVTGKLINIQFNASNLTTPIGSQSNTTIYTIAGTPNYSFTYVANAFNLFANGVYLEQGTDYTTGTNTYTFSTTPNNNLTILQQQTYSRAGAA